MISRQRRWQLKKLTQGLCKECGKQANGHIHCRVHADKFNANQLKWKAKKFKEN